MSRHMIIALCACLAIAAGGAEAKSKPKAATQTQGAADSATTSSPSSGETDVIGSKEAPAVSNIVPWKDKNAVLPKKEVTTSILRETLQPLDPEVLQREILFQQSLTRQ